MVDIVQEIAGERSAVQMEGWMEYNNADGKAEVLYR
jgi:hypothetical protein